MPAASYPLCGKTSKLRPAGIPVIINCIAAILQQRELREILKPIIS